MLLSELIKNYRIILASQSPRRQELLRDLGITFDTVVRDYDETYPAALSGEEIARFISAAKAQSFKSEISDNEIVITADTIVWCENTVLGKPVDKNDAIRMIREISGKTHEVITAVSLLSKSKMTTFSDTTKVTFNKLDDEEIVYYVERFKPFDKAGAYGIQEWIGLAACSSVEGSYFNVVGLPVQKLYIELQNFILNM